MEAIGFEPTTPCLQSRRSPAELRPLTGTELQANARPPNQAQKVTDPRTKARMGQGGLEPPTPRLSSVCSNQLSYWPKRKRQASQSASPPGKDARPAPHPRRSADPAPEPTTTWIIENSQRKRPPASTESHSEQKQFWQEHHSRKGKPFAPHGVSLKGGDPAAGSPTATLLRLHPSR
jgi:hypothetical protein